MLISVPAWSAIDATEHRRLCIAASTSIERNDEWIPVYSPTLRQYAEELLPHANLWVSDVVLCTSNDPGADPTWSRLMRHGWTDVLVVGVSYRFGVAMTEHLRAIMAHEVAHWIPNNSGGACDKVLRTKKDEDHLLCEHDVDRTGASWVGKSSMLAALRAALRYFETDENSTARRISLEKRIKLLEKSP